MSFITDAAGTINLHAEMLAMWTGKSFISHGPALAIEPRGGVVIVIERLLRIRHVVQTVFIVKE